MLSSTPYSLVVKFLYIITWILKNQILLDGYKNKSLLIKLNFLFSRLIYDFYFILNWTYLTYIRVFLIVTSTIKFCFISVSMRMDNSKLSIWYSSISFHKKIVFYIFALITYQIMLYKYYVMWLTIMEFMSETNGSRHLVR